jgi:hypothetical protein
MSGNVPLLPLYAFMVRTVETLPNSTDYFLWLSFKNIFKFMTCIFSVTVIHLVSLNVYNLLLWIYRRIVLRSRKYSWELSRYFGSFLKGFIRDV